MMSHVVWLGIVGGAGESLILHRDRYGGSGGFRGLIRDRGLCEGSEAALAVDVGVEID